MIIALRLEANTKMSSKHTNRLEANTKMSSKHTNRLEANINSLESLTKMRGPEWEVWCGMEVQGKNQHQWRNVDRE